MIAEADEEGMLTATGTLSDETLSEEVTEVLEALNVTETEAPKNTEIENAVTEEEVVAVTQEETVEEITNDEGADEAEATASQAGAEESK